ncbi:MAG: DNA polymerase III subunit delta [Chloroflexi bacterium]|nr:DNA polymerase III subunit delta [Chloroflexota bacterium]
MPEAPTIYLFHGEDGPAIHAALASLQSRLGDPSTVEMNSSRLSGAGLSLDELRAAAFAIPFLAERRLVILEEPSRAYPRATAEARAPFIAILNETPPSTALVLVEPSDLKASHWLLKWAKAAGGRAFVKQFSLPQAGAMPAWIQAKAKELGGEIQPPAAAVLASLLGSDTRAAEHEIEKLLAYANFARPITADDVALLALEIGEQGDFFGLIDALSAGSGAQAMQALRKLMDERDHISLFFGLVGHFRALLQTKEIVESGGKEADVAKQLSAHPFRAKKLTGQSRRFDLATLEAIYQRLLELDHQIKTGQIESELAMETLTAALTA